MTNTGDEGKGDRSGAPPSPAGRSMRVLSLGAHEGFVEMWLLEQWRDAKLQIDAVELHPDNVAACKRRGINCVQGFAEDAYRHFEPGSYDVVVAYELIEHVPDVQRLLSVCEQMLRPSGLVVISTPNGTFGTGANPHHLRVFRSIDLAELLRRRGNLHRMAVGRDGLTLAAYRPAPRRGELAIHTGGGWMRWAPQDIEEKGLGGSETAAVKLAEALAAQGWVVTVYGEMEQGCHGDVVYRHTETFDPLTRRDVLISSRQPELFDRPVNAAVKLLWCHDTDYGERLTQERRAHIDKVLVLSRWHYDHTAGLYPGLVSDLEPGPGFGEALEHPKLVQIRNGIELANFNLNGSAPARKKRVVYTSSPDRGLDILLELWPRVRKRVKGATLEFAYAPVYFKIAESDPVVAAHAQKIEELSRQPGVKALGSLSQPAVARLLASSLVWVCPSYNTPHQVPFMETSCIGAMEAQASGCAIVASNWGALPETVQVGSLIDAEPASEMWRDCLVEAIVRGLSDQAVQADAQRRGPEAVAGWGWDGVAEQITEIVAP